jgi:C4-dicarboxylate transporter DctM subunit
MAKNIPSNETPSLGQVHPAIAALRSSDTGLRRLTEFMSSIGTIWFFALVILICAEVFLREVFLSPIRGVTEMVAYSVVGATFLQLAGTLYSERMTRADFLVSILGKRMPKGEAVLEVVVSVIGVIAMILLLQAALPKFMDAYTEAEIVGNPGEFSFQVWPLRLLVIIGSAVTALAFAARALRKTGALMSEYGINGLVWLAVTCVVLVAMWFILFPMLMDAGLSNFTLGAMMLGVLVVVVLFGVHIGIAMLVIGFVGLWLLKGRIAFGYTMLGIAGNEFLANY